MGLLKKFKAVRKEVINHKRELKKQEIFLRVQERLALEFKLNKEKIKLESRIKEDLGLDSVDAIQVVMALEDEFGFEIPDQDIEEIMTVEQIVDYLLTKLK